MSVNSKTHELKQRMQLVLQGGGEKAVEKQKAIGKLTARERILELLDEGSFHEYDLFVLGLLITKQANEFVEGIKPCLGNLGQFAAILNKTSVK